jgi:hypothetical protein
MARDKARAKVRDYGTVRGWAVGKASTMVRGEV